MHDKAADQRVRCNDVLNGGAPRSRERLPLRVPRFRSTSVVSRETSSHKGQHIQAGASGALNAEQSRIQLSTCRATFNARINAPPDTTNMRERLKGGRVQ